MIGIGTSSLISVTCVLSERSPCFQRLHLIWSNHHSARTSFYRVQRISVRMHRKARRTSQVVGGEDHPFQLRGEHEEADEEAAGSRRFFSRGQPFR